MMAQRADGFTLVEVLVAIGLSTIVAAGVFLLVSTGIDAHDRGHELSMDVASTSETAALLRADLARATSITFAGPDSLELALPSGADVSYALRSTPRGMELYRSVDLGSGWVESPLRPLATLADRASTLASATFIDLGSGRVRSTFVSHGDSYVLESSLWRQP
jgi:prepilin-type N-terminal cleavage/methylation domain-containing protein